MGALTDGEVSARADKARKILDNEIYKEAWETYRARIFEQFEAAKSNDTETIMQLKRLLAAAAAARAHFDALIVDGKIAEFDLEHARKTGRLRSAREVFPER